MANRITVQDIADALGLSRNTVSKAINNSPGLSAITRERVLNKAAEMGYKQFSYIQMLKEDRLQQQEESSSETSSDIQNELHPHCREIALIMEGFQDSSHFAHTMIDSFQREIAQLGYSMTVHHLNSDEINSLQLPPTLHLEYTDGILCVEIFSEAYAQMLCTLEIPTLFVDTPVIRSGEALPSDILLMENGSGISAFVRDMLNQGQKDIGFVGHSYHCRSFFERYMSFRNSMMFHGGTINEDFCLTDTWQGKRYPSREEYHAYLADCLSRLEHLPDVFICANDAIAMDMLVVCKKLGWSVPDDVMLCGFDDAPEASVITPSLTSIHIHSQVMGLTAALLLLSRIQERDLHFRTVYTETSLIYRESAPLRDGKSD